MITPRPSPHHSVTFDEWLAELDSIFWQEMGISHDDFTDQPWKDWYQDEFTPKDAFYMAIEAEYPGTETPEVYEPSCYVQEFDTFSDADPGL